MACFVDTNFHSLMALHICKKMHQIYDVSLESVLSPYPSPPIQDEIEAEEDSVLEKVDALDLKCRINPLVHCGGGRERERQLSRQLSVQGHVHCVMPTRAAKATHPVVASLGPFSRQAKASTSTSPSRSPSPIPRFSLPSDVSFEKILCDFAISRLSPLTSESLDGEGERQSSRRFFLQPSLASPNIILLQRLWRVHFRNTICLGSEGELFFTQEASKRNNGAPRKAMAFFRQTTCIVQYVQYLSLLTRKGGLSPNT